MKSQWDFGELFPVEQTRKVLSVTELTWEIRRVLEKHVGLIWVTGEITNLRVQGSGHIYFTLKDAGAQLSCVLFRGELQVDSALLQDGRKVVLGGDITVYELRGQYQLRVTTVELQGLGALQAAFEKLKLKLKAEGLFATERKRPLPRFPQRIGLVTSPTGAAIRDVLHVVKRRNPGLELILAPCRVQGDGAALEIAAAIRLLNDFHKRQQGGLDLILVTRGGGSLEDLWAFNEERVARAIFESALPVVSAVGHEIDFTISDFVADVRAATPSAAAEVLTEGVFSSCQFVSEATARLGQLARQQMADKQYVLNQAGLRLGRLHPRRRFNEWLQRLDDLQTTLSRCAQQGVRRQRLAWRNLSDRLGRLRPAFVLKQRREVLDQAGQRLREQVRHRLRETQQRLDALQIRLRLLGPEQVLARGYSITMDTASGRVLRAAAEARQGQTLRTRLAQGEIVSRVDTNDEERRRKSYE
ncbi:MAG TPA: exodeoxyribonuclease VII large subunit [Verrucomicrobiae bacterium]|nr:exodeoxyribonuclease VII large subunit [Verrucomicrobiae bacterium]